MITLITSKIKSKRPDLLLLQDFEKFCAENSNWNTATGALLPHPNPISTRFYTLLHYILQPILRLYKKKGAVVSLGLPYRLFLYSKTFPYFTINSDLRVLWTYDVWQPKYREFEHLVRESKINLLMLSSLQATKHFRKLKIPNCDVHWIPESINTADYQFKPWNERKIHLLSFGRSYSKYHEEIVTGCKLNNINYQFEDRDDNRDVAVERVKASTLQFPTREDFIAGLADTKICICFPKALTHPEYAGDVSTFTLRYLEAMASKCLLIGSAPAEAEYLFDYNPMIEIDWNNPVDQIKEILENPGPYLDLVEKNYNTVLTKFHYSNSITKIEQLIKISLFGKKAPSFKRTASHHYHSMEKIA